MVPKKHRSKAELSIKQELITERELQTYLEDGWKGVGVLQNGQIVVELDEFANMTIRRIINQSEVETHLKEGWNIATIRTALVLPSGRYVIERTKSLTISERSRH